MPTLDISATFPLGVYLGHRADGSPDPFPDIARLHSALLHAAATGTTAKEQDGRVQPSEDGLAALRWLEEHPPSRLHVPTHRRQSNDENRITYRNEGWFEKSKFKVSARRMSEGTTFDGPIAYSWDDVPEAVVETVFELCSDVAVLGEGGSLVKLEHRSLPPTLVLDTEASMFTPGGEYIRGVAPGRTDALIQAFEAANPGKGKAQKTAKKEDSRTAEATTTGLRDLRYRRPDAPASSTPWDQVLLLELDGDVIPEQHRQAWCVAMHRAIIAAIQSGVPPMVTGQYPKTMPDRPSNHLSIQYLTKEQVERHGLQNHAIALLLPNDATAEDLIRLAQGLESIRTLRCKYGRRRLEFNGVAVRAEEFWEAPKPGSYRLWLPTPLAVTEVRSPKRSRTGGRPWGLADAGLVSIALAWSAFLPKVKGNSDERHIARHEKARNYGVRVARTTLRAANTQHFIYKTRKGSVPQMWTGLIDLGELAPTTVMAAIGQSRHLGGGLLVPVDVPEALVTTLMGGN
ncbi:type I-G CRISPR-associated protein Csb2 [Corynebacterium gerontici]|uniref:CRISPR-associated protein n=1 Tax=Corynebacterium gerontici TaxID=2079234 RepID=A0A3G6IXW5_9CORY|nr:type I-U CRISPR-associated protein Csb2 [Corynebacterium gerontici]AZA10486.1 hypothetical protein CGERO_00755 [Corynebacterium gerontici]